ncbi:MAG: hypothetical protein K2Y21_06200 [Phycisphaerales bacterium]|nr:hypothetical protein [Phycisphaerales bacterium]
MGIATLVFTVMPKTIVIIIPTGYRGDIVIVKDEQGDVGVHRAGAYWYEAPESCVLRVKDIERFLGHTGGAGSGSRFECHEKNGNVIRQRSLTPSEPSLMADGPWGEARVTVVSVFLDQNSRGPFVPATQLEAFWKSGVPRDFVAPHIIVRE